MGKEIEGSGEEKKNVSVEHTVLKKIPWFKIHSHAFLSSKAKASAT